ncbi:MAG: TolC family protein [Cyclobacteriaceae bacterium]|nr:TolC family protein [Cyclobacteriaceae bacterium]
MKIIYTLFLLLVGGTAFAQGVSGQKAYSLDDCIQFALENNQNIKNAQLEYESSEYRVGEILSIGLPQLDVATDLGYNFVVPTSFIPAEFVGGEVGTFIPVQFSPAYNGQAYVGLKQMVFDGSYFVGLQASRTYTERARKEKIKTEIDIVADVSKAYYLVLVNIDRLELIDKNYARLDSLYKETQVMFDNGFVEKIDVSRIKVQLNNLAVEKNNFSNTLDVSYAILKFQMGMDINTSITLLDKIEDIKLDALDENFGSDFTYDDRIEVSLLNTNLDLANYDIKNTQSQYLPKLDLYGRIGASSGAGTSSDFFQFGDNWYGFGILGLQLNIPVFDGLRKHRLIQQKRITADQIENNQDLVKQNIDLEIKTTKSALKKSFDNLLAQRENMELAENVYNVSKIKYEEGIGSNLEVIEADADFKQAQTNYYNALFEAIVAKIDLEKSYGKLWNPNKK